MPELTCKDENNNWVFERGAELPLATPYVLWYKSEVALTELQDRTFSAI